MRPRRRSVRVKLRQAVIWELLDQLNTSQNELAGRYGTSRGYISQLMWGERSPSARHRRPGAGPQRRRAGADTRAGAGLNELAFPDLAVRDARMVARYYTRQRRLHGGCFPNGLCDPIEDTERRTRETADHIADAEASAEGEIR